MEEKRFKIVGYFLRGAGLLILLAFISTVDFEGLGRAFAGIDYMFLAAALILVLLNLVVKGVRWALIVRLFSGERLSIGSSTLLVVSGVAAASVIPGRMDFSKPLILKETRGIGLRLTAPGVVVERVMDVLSLFVLLFVSGLVLGVWSGNLVITLLFAASVVAVLLFIFPRLSSAVFELAPVLEGVREKAADAFSVLAERKTYLISISFLSLLAMLLEVGRLFCIFHSLDIRVSLSSAMFAFTSSILIGLATLIPGGLGVTELSQAEVVGKVGLQHMVAGEIKGAVLLDRFFSYYLLVLTGSIILISYRRLMRGQAVK